MKALFVSFILQRQFLTRLKVAYVEKFYFSSLKRNVWYMHTGHGQELISYKVQSLYSHFRAINC